MNYGLVLIEEYIKEPRGYGNVGMAENGEDLDLMLQKRRNVPKSRA